MVHWNKYKFFVIHKPLLNDTDMFVHVTSCLFFIPSDTLSLR
jgi:hypothetical protein